MPTPGSNDCIVYGNLIRGYQNFQTSAENRLERVNALAEYCDGQKQTFDSLANLSQYYRVGKWNGAELAGAGGNFASASAAFKANAAICTEQIGIAAQRITYYAGKKCGYCRVCCPPPPVTPTPSPTKRSGGGR